MDVKGVLDKKLGDLEYRRLYQQEKLILDVTDLIDGALEVKSVSRAKFARMLNRSRSFVTQILSGGRNLTLRTLADSMTTLGFEVQVSKQPIETDQTLWLTWSVPEYPTSEARFAEPAFKSVKGPLHKKSLAA